MHRTRYLIGLFTLALAIAGAWFLWHLVGRADDRPGLRLSIEFRDARGLRAGSDVRYRGVTTGSVRSVQIAQDGSKAVVEVLIEPGAAPQACVNSTFWIVSPRVHGLMGGVSGLDTLVRDSYLSFHTPDPHGSPLLAGSVLGGAERPPAALEPESLEPLQHGDLLMTLLVPENFGLRPGSPVVFRGTTTGDVRSVQLAAEGTHIEVQLRIGNRYRRTVTDQSEFWVARPYVSGALLSGFTVGDVAAIVAPFVSYIGDEHGTPVEDGYRVAAEATRPTRDPGPVPQSALARPTATTAAAPREPLVLARVVYAAVERDTFSADDPVAREGTAVLYLDGNGRTLALTARSVVDGNYTESDSFGAAPDIAEEQIKVVVAGGPVLRAHRVWVAPDSRDLAVLVLDEPPPDLPATPASMFAFDGDSLAGATVRTVRVDGSALPATTLGDPLPALADARGAVLLRGDHVAGVLGQAAALHNDEPAPVHLDVLPADLRPRP